MGGGGRVVGGNIQSQGITWFQILQQADDSQCWNHCWVSLTSHRSYQTLINPGNTLRSYIKQTWTIEMDSGSNITTGSLEISQITDTPQRAGKKKTPTSVRNRFPQQATVTCTEILHLWWIGKDRCWLPNFHLPVPSFHLAFSSSLVCLETLGFLVRKF